MSWCAALPSDRQWASGHGAKDHGANRDRLSRKRNRTSFLVFPRGANPIQLSADAPRAPSAAAEPQPPKRREEPPCRRFLPGFEWLPLLAEGDSQADAVLRWDEGRALPEPSGRGPTRHPLPPEAATKVRIRKSGHEKAQSSSEPSLIRPRIPESGHRIGPRPAVLDQVARARAFQAWIDAAPERSAAQLARREGVSRSRISQILSLARLSDGVLDRLASDERPLAEAALRRVAAEQGAAAQLRQYNELARAHATRRGSRPLGFQLDLSRARSLRERWESGDFDSLEALGRDEGITGARVHQLLNLLQLHPAILDVIDVPPAELASGVTKSGVRRIARLRDQSAQLAAFHELADAG